MLAAPFDFLCVRSRAATGQEKAKEDKGKSFHNDMDTDVSLFLLLGICFRARRTVDGWNGDRRRGVRGFTQECNEQ